MNHSGTYGQRQKEHAGLRQLRFLRVIALLAITPLMPHSAVASAAVKPEAAPRPNVILIMTDDQGYGDLACHGNPWLRTPHLDKLHAESVRMTDFHVSAFCTPTRAALMTGRYPGRTGAFRTSSGRTMMHTDERTIAHVFQDAGYVTGMVGKWHLGDNAPHRPQDRGFDDVVWHRCGGVGQASDFWGNDYFDDTYERNGTFEKFDGYCTDVWFEQSLKFIQANKDRPFFLYLATNAPHGPYRVDPKWAAPYQKTATWGSAANFYGMIANIDHNMGRLRQRLDELHLTDNTVLVFMTDNGTSAGGKFSGLTAEPVAGYNAGMRGRKSCIYEGGHRVPCFVYWPAGQIGGGRDVDALTAHIDILPTLAELCGVKVPPAHHPDGLSFANLLTSADALPKRDHLIVQYHGGAGAGAPLEPWIETCVLQDKWRLINGEALYNVSADPAQRNEISAAHPDVVQRLKAFYPPFWESISPRLSAVSIDIGNPADNPTTLCSQDWYMPRGNPPWNFGSIRKRPKVTGPWNIHIRMAGTYRLTLRQLPQEASQPVVASTASVTIAGITAQQPVKPNSSGVVFELTLPAGKTQLTTAFTDDAGKTGGAYFVDVELLP